MWSQDGTFPSTSKHTGRTVSLTIIWNVHYLDIISLLCQQVKLLELHNRRRRSTMTESISRFCLLLFLFFFDFISRTIIIDFCGSPGSTLIHDHESEIIPHAYRNQMSDRCNRYRRYNVVNSAETNIIKILCVVDNNNIYERITWFFFLFLFFVLNTF